MKSIIHVVILIFIMSCAEVCADCRLTDTPQKFEVVCYGNDPSAPPKGSRKSGMRPTGGKKKKTTIAEKESIASVVDMTDEELKFMAARNKMDGYGGKTKRKAQTAKN